MAKVGKKRIYESAQAFARAVNSYFSAISYLAPVEISVEKMTVDPKTGESVPMRDADGHVIFEKQTVLTEDKKPAYARCWIEAPSITGLCLYMGLGSRETWRQYAAREEYKEICALAKSRVEEYLTQQLGTKAASGAKFALEHNFGWKERVEHSLDTQTQKAITTSGMSMQEKREYLAALMQQAKGEGDGSDGA